MRRNSFSLASVVFLSAACIAHAADGETRPISLLSVATPEAYLELARPASQGPAVALEAEPYTEEFILKLSGEAQVAAIKANERVRAANARALAVANLADAEDHASRQAAAGVTLGNSALGRCELKVSDLFGEALPEDGPFVLVGTDANGHVPSSDNGVYVRLLFSEPVITPPISQTPGISNEPVTVKLPVMVKAESSEGATLMLNTFEQKVRLPNPDHVMGKNLEKVLDKLVREAVDEVFNVLSK